MKKYILLLLAVTFMSCVIANDYSNGDKYYIQPGSVHVAPNGIFLIVDGELSAVQSLQTDENGVYIPSTEAGICGKHGYFPGWGPCPKCPPPKYRKK